MLTKVQKQESSLKKGPENIITDPSLELQYGWIQMLLKAVLGSITSRIRAVNPLFLHSASYDVTNQRTTVHYLGCHRSCFCGNVRAAELAKRGMESPGLGQRPCLEPFRCKEMRARVDEEFRLEL